MKSSPTFSRKALFFLFVVVLGWGTSWTVIKYSIVEIPPLSFRGISALIGGIGLLLIGRIGGQSVAVPAAERGRLIVLALFNTTIWNALATYGVLFLPSGRAALLAYTMPMWCVPLTIWWLDETLSRQRVVALLLGLGGILVLMRNGSQAIVAAPAGVALMLGAALSWACGVVLFKRWQVAMPTLPLTGWLLAVGAIPLLLGAAVIEGIPARVPGYAALAGLVFSALVTFMLCNWAWNHFVLLVPVSVSSLSSLLTPVVSVISGAIFLGERPGWQEVVAALLILGSVAVINVRLKGDG